MNAGHSLRSCLTSLAVGGALLLSAACSDEKADTPPPAASNVRYAIGTSISNGEATSTYVIPAETLEGDATLNLDNAVELSGRAKIFAGAEPGTIFALQPPTMTKYKVGADGRFAAVGSIDFSGRGVVPTRFIGSFVRVLSPTKGYLFSNTTSEVVLFNPTDLTITGAVKLDLPNVPGNSVHFTFGDGVLRGSQVLFGADYGAIEGEAVAAETHFIVFDTATDTVSAITRDTRCGGVYLTFQTGSGDVYFATDVWAASIHRLDPPSAPDPCLRRIRPGSNTPDPDYAVLTKTLVDGKTPTAPGINATGDQIYVYLLNEEKAKITEATTADELHAGPAWDWYRIDLSNPSFTPRKVGLFGGTHFSFNLGAGTFTYTSSEEFKNARMLKTSVEGDPVPGVTVPGTPSTLVDVP